MGHKRKRGGDWRTKCGLLSWSNFRCQYQKWSIGINTTLIEELVLLFELFFHYDTSWKNLNKNHHKTRKSQQMFKSYSSISMSSHWNFYWKITIKMRVHLFLVITVTAVRHIMTGENKEKFWQKKQSRLFSKVEVTCLIKIKQGLYTLYIIFLSEFK